MYQIVAPDTPTNYVSIKIEFSAGTMINYTTWIPASEHTQHYGDLFATRFADITVQIMLNDQSIFEKPVDHGVTVFEHQMLDSADLHLKQLKIALTGFGPQHHCSIDRERDSAVMVRINNIWLEDLNLRSVMEDTGKCVYDRDPAAAAIPSEFMGDNGYQLLEFTTPVYGWLLDQYKKPSYYLDPRGD